MANVLNLTIKKDIFGNILDGSCNEICVDKTNWWQKRLIDKDGNFKNYDVAIISSNNTEKLEYPISSIKETADSYCISIVNVNTKQEDVDEVANDEVLDVVETNEESVVEVSQLDETKDVELDNHQEDIVDNESLEETEALEVEPQQTDTYNEIVVDNSTDENIDDTTQEEGIVEPEDWDSVEEYDYRNDVMGMLDIFCEMKDVYNVSYKDVRIKTNGRIVGCYDKKLMLNSDYEIRFEFEHKEFIHPKYISDEDFTSSIGMEFKNMLSQNYVFVNKSKCGFIKSDTGENIFVMTVVTKKKYMFR